MKILQFGGVSVQIDVERTVALYDPRLNPWRPFGCECDFCTNTQITSGRFIPPAQIDLIRECGIDPERPFYNGFSSEQPRVPHWTRRLAYWRLYGEFDGAEPTPFLRLAPGHRLWIGKHWSSVRPPSRWNSNVDLADPQLLYLFASNALPWLYREVREFRSEYVGEGCPKCGMQWRETGYLHRQSKIPCWYNRPDLRRILIKREQRVWVEFCVRCGRLEAESVDRKRPFRRRNECHRSYIRATKNRWAAEGRERPQFALNPQPR